MRKLRKQIEATQWDTFKELLNKHSSRLQENNNRIIKCIQIDFEKEILIINGKAMQEPVLVALPYIGEWERRKIFHAKEYCKNGSLPEISISIKNSDKLKY